MTKIGYYRQKRLDGGMRTAITFEDSPVLGQYAAAKDDSNPVLAWYVDIRCEGRRLPTEPEPERLRAWFLKHAQQMREGLSQLAEELKAGVDTSSWPLERSIAGLRGVKTRIICAAIRSLTALDIAAVLKDVEDHLEERIRNLKKEDTVY